MIDLDGRTRAHRQRRTGRPRRVRVVRMGHHVKSEAIAPGTDLVTSLVVGTAAARHCRRAAAVGQAVKGRPRAWMFVHMRRDRADTARRLHSFPAAVMVIIEVGLTAARAITSARNHRDTMLVPITVTHRTTATPSITTGRIITVGLP